MVELNLIGFGVDVEKIDRFSYGEKLINDHLIKRFLSVNEWGQYQQLLDSNARKRFLVSRWVAKEAIIKSFGSNIQNLGFDKIDLISFNKNWLWIAPDQTFVAQISISYSDDVALGSCLLFKNKHKQRIEIHLLNDHIFEFNHQISEQMKQEWLKQKIQTKKTT